MRKVLYSWSSF